ncbi:hypothetical protein PFISCL1PPCAC_25499, partial [Pristionchus fissidentatus]
RQLQQVQPSIVLSTQSAKLQIYLQCADCSLSITEDHKFLIFSSVGTEPLSKVELSLKNSEGDPLPSPLVSFLSPNGRESSIRIDSLLPLVFDPVDDIVIVPKKMLSWSDFPMRTSVYHLDVVTQFSNILCEPFLTPIHSASLVVDEDTVVVSRELLALHSPFFLSLFYSEFMEKNKNVYEIKEVMVDDFRWFIDCLHGNDWNFPSIDRALSTLAFADRFGVMHIHDRVLPYLKQWTVPVEMLQDTLILAGRFSDNHELLDWILSQFPSHSLLLEVIENCVGSLPDATMRAALKAFRLAMEAVNKEVQADLLRNMVAGMDSKSLLVHLKCHSLEGGIVEEKIFTVGLDSDNDILYTPFWAKVPDRYQKVVLSSGRWEAKPALRTNKIPHIGYGLPEKTVMIDAYDS